MFKHRDVQNEDDDDNCVHYGTAFPPLDEDEQPIRKPVPIHEQTVTDERGKGFVSGILLFVPSSLSQRICIKSFCSPRFIDNQISRSG